MIETMSTFRSSEGPLSQLSPLFLSINGLGLRVLPLDLIEAGVAEGGVDLLLVDRSGATCLLPAVCRFKDSGQELREVCVALLPVSSENMIIQQS